jgi:hypothetical protein
MPLGRSKKTVQDLNFMGHMQLLVYADDVNLLRGNKNTIKIKTGALTDAIKEVGLEVTTEKKLSICCCLVTRMQGKLNTKLANTIF